MKLLKKSQQKGNGKENTGARQGDGLTGFRDDVNKAFERMWQSFGRGPLTALEEFAPWPPVDVSEDDARITLKADVPGMDAADVTVEVSGNLVQIRGQRTDESTGKEGGICRHERRSGAFTRVVTLPSYAKMDAVEARYDKGTLTISVPKIPGAGPRRIAVKG